MDDVNAGNKIFPPGLGIVYLLAGITGLWVKSFPTNETMYVRVSHHLT